MTFAPPVLLHDGRHGPPLCLLCGETRRLPCRRKRDIAAGCMEEAGLGIPRSKRRHCGHTGIGPLTLSFEQLELDEAIEQGLEGGVGWNVETRTQLPNARPRLAHVENLEDERID